MAINSICGPNLFGDDGENGFIKVGDGSLDAIQGGNLIDSLNLKGLRIPFNQLSSGSLILPPGTRDKLICSPSDKITFLAIKVSYDDKISDKHLKYRMGGCDCDMHMSQLMILTGTCKHPINKIALTNPHDFKVKIEVMMASEMCESVEMLGDPIVYFNEGVYMMNAPIYPTPFNSTYGNDFGYTFSIDEIVSQGGSMSATFSYMDLYDLIVDEIRDSNGETMTIDENDFHIHDFNGVTISGITQSGTYSLHFDIIDENDKYLDSNLNVTVEIYDNGFGEFGYFQHGYSTP